MRFLCRMFCECSEASPSARSCRMVRVQGSGSGTSSLARKSCRLPLLVSSRANQSVDSTTRFSSHGPSNTTRFSSHGPSNTTRFSSHGPSNTTHLFPHGPSNTTQFSLHGPSSTTRFSSHGPTMGSVCGQHDTVQFIQTKQHDTLFRHGPSMGSVCGQYDTVRSHQPNSKNQLTFLVYLSKNVTNFPGESNGLTCMAGALNGRRQTSETLSLLGSGDSSVVRAPDS